MSSFRVLPDPGIEPVSPVAPELQADPSLLSHRWDTATHVLRSLPLCKRRKAHMLKMPNEASQVS